MEKKEEEKSTNTKHSSMKTIPLRHITQKTQPLSMQQTSKSKWLSTLSHTMNFELWPQSNCFPAYLPKKAPKCTPSQLVYMTVSLYVCASITGRLWVELACPPSTVQQQTVCHANPDMPPTMPLALSPPPLAEREERGMGGGGGWGKKVGGRRREEGERKGFGGGWVRGKEARGEEGMRGMGVVGKGVDKRGWRRQGVGGGRERRKGGLKGEWVFFTEGGSGTSYDAGSDS